MGRLVFLDFSKFHPLFRYHRVSSCLLSSPAQIDTTLHPFKENKPDGKHPQTSNLGRDSQTPFITKLLLVQSKSFTLFLNCKKYIT